MKSTAILRITILVLIIITPFMCTKSYYEEFEIVDPILDKKYIERGKLFAENLKFVVRKMKPIENEYADRADFFAQATEYSELFYNQKTNLKVDMSVDIGVAYDRYYEGITETQRSIIVDLSDAYNESISYLDYRNKIATINNSIAESIESEDQSRLYHLTSTLIFSLDAFNELAEEGLIPGNPEKIRTKRRYIFSNSNLYGQGQGSDDGSWFCPPSDHPTATQWLSTLWAIALVEPTPFGEVIASGATVVVYGIQLYIGVTMVQQAVTNCIHDLILDQYDDLTVDECIYIYAYRCTSGPCDDCLQFCRLNHSLDPRCQTM